MISVVAFSRWQLYSREPRDKLTWRALPTTRVSQVAGQVKALGTKLPMPNGDWALSSEVGSDLQCSLLWLKWATPLPVVYLSVCGIGY